MRNGLWVGGAVLAASLTAAAPAAATVTFEEAKFSGSAFAFARHIADEGTLTANTLPTSPLTQSRSNYASAHGSSARAKGSINFTDEATGDFALDEVYAGSRWFKEEPSGASASLGLTYVFTIDQSYLMRFTYDLAIDPRTSVDFYLYKGNTKVTSGGFEAGQGFLFTDAFGPGTYTLNIDASSRAESSAKLAEEYDTASGNVGFALLRNGRGPASPTPEPSSWALMIAGFGLAGASLRRRMARDRQVVQSEGG